jgi:hypothetical protein
MKTPESALNAGKRFAAIASGRAFSEDAPKQNGTDASQERAQGAAKPRHASIGVKDDIQEHESERLNPGSSGGSASGASAEKPKGSSNSA